MSNLAGQDAARDPRGDGEPAEDRRCRPSRFRSRILTIVGLLAGALATACNTPTEVSPLARSLGQVRGMVLEVEGLLPLGIEDAAYALWAFEDDGTPRSLGEFNIGPGGNPVDAEGNPIERFTTDSNIINALSVLITVRLPGGSTNQPSDWRVLSGPIVEGVASLRVPGPGEIQGASGSFRVFTPTDGPGTNEGSGIWAVDVDGDPTLDLPATTRAFTYELFLVVGGDPLTLGRFNDPESADTSNRFSGEEEAPDVPGEDFLQDPPAGLVFPLDLGGTRLIITLEPIIGDLAAPTQFVVLEATLPPGLVGGETISMVNRAAEFPTGTAVLF